MVESKKAKLTINFYCSYCERPENEHLWPRTCAFNCVSNPSL